MSSTTLISDVATRLVTKAKTEGELTIADCTASLGRRSVMLAILLFAMVNSLPLPGIPGLSTVTGIPIMLLGIQIMLGGQKIWLPKKIRNVHLGIEKFLIHMEKFIPRLKKMERKLRPRLVVLCNAPFCNIIGAIIAFMGFMLALPIPFTNFPFGLSLCIMTIGLIAHDGLVLILGLVCSITSTLGFFMLVNTALA